MKDEGKQGRRSRENETPTARRPYLGDDDGCRPPLQRGSPDFCEVLKCKVSKSFKFC